MLYKSFIKPLFDFSIAVFGLIITSPILLIVFFLLLFMYRENPFFFQKRPGRSGRIFNIIKFKTMNNRRDENGGLLSDSERLTPIGIFVRKTSLDELPQLINILKGDMSLIGPRPLLPEYLSLYNETQIRRHEVKPGITGWAQVNGRNAISWEQKFLYDVWYADNISVALDLKIFWLTILKVFKREGISQEGNVTTQRFNGNN